MCVCACHTGHESWPSVLSAIGPPSHLSVPTPWFWVGGNYLEGEKHAGLGAVDRNIEHIGVLLMMPSLPLFEQDTSLPNEPPLGRWMCSDLLLLLARPPFSCQDGWTICSKPVIRAALVSKSHLLRSAFRYYLSREKSNPRTACLTPPGGGGWTKPGACWPTPSHHMAAALIKLWSKPIFPAYKSYVHSPQYGRSPPLPIEHIQVLLNTASTRWQWLVCLEIPSSVWWVFLINDDIILK